MVIVEAIRTVILPLLKSWASELEEEYAQVKVGVYDHTYGSLSASGENICGITCVFREAPDYPDEICLEITISPTTMATGDIAYVIWVYPGYVEAELPPRVISTPEEAIEVLQAGLPDFYRVLKTTVERGYPSRKH